MGKNDTTEEKQINEESNKWLEKVINSGNPRYVMVNIVKSTKTESGVVNTGCEVIMNLGTLDDREAYSLIMAIQKLQTMVMERFGEVAFSVKASKPREVFNDEQEDNK